MDVKDELVKRGYSVFLAPSVYSKVFICPVEKHVLFSVHVDFLGKRIYLEHSACDNLEQDVSFRWSGDLITVIALEDFAYSLWIVPEYHLLDKR